MEAKNWEEQIIAAMRDPEKLEIIIQFLKEQGAPDALHQAARGSQRG